MEDTIYDYDDHSLLAAISTNNFNNNNNNHGWQKVTYAKRRKNPQQNKQLNKQPQTAAAIAESGADKDDNIFQAIEKQAEDRHRRIRESLKQTAVFDDDNDEYQSRKSRSKRRGNDEYTDDSESENNVEEKKKDDDKVEKKKKKRAEKKPKVSVSEAAAKMDADDLAAFLVDLSGSFEEDVQLLKFADYFARALSEVTSSQFPWVKILRETPVRKFSDIPVSHIPDAVYRTSIDWISQRSVIALGSFVKLLLDAVHADLNGQLPSVKNTKKASRQQSSKSQVAIFMVLAIILRRKPDALVGLLPTLREDVKYQGQEKLSLIIWVISQACQGDLAVGLCAWAHNLLPLLNNKSTNNPLCRDMILQLIERILAAPKARTILINGAVRKGERLIPPTELEILVRATFPVSSARVKATERFEAVYPTLKEVALAGVPGSKAMKQVSQQIFGFAILAAGEGKPELVKEATDIAVWCLAQNNDIYKQWDKLYLDNMEASVAVLKKFCEEKKEQNINQSSVEALKQTLRSFQQQNEKSLAGESPRQAALLKDADKYCKMMLGRLSRSHGCLKAMTFVAVATAVGVAVMSSTNLEPFDWKRVSVMLSSLQSF